jgi:hypothetical protein
LLKAILTMHNPLHEKVRPELHLPVDSGERRQYQALVNQKSDILKLLNRLSVVMGRKRPDVSKVSDGASDLGAKLTALIIEARKMSLLPDAGELLGALRILESASSVSDLGRAKLKVEAALNSPSNSGKKN